VTPPHTVVYVNATDEPGGSDASLFEVIRCLDPARYAAHVILPHAGPFAAAYRALGVPVHIVPLKKMKNTWDARWHAAYLLRAPARIHRVHALLTRLQPRIVHINSSVEWLAGLAARRYCTRSGARLVWHVREAELRPALVERLVFGAVLRWADRIIAISRPVAGRMGTDARIDVVSVGVDLTRAPDPAAALSPRPPVIGWVGRLAPGKGVETALQVFEVVAAAWPDARLAIQGATVPEHSGFAVWLRGVVARHPAADRIEWNADGEPGWALYPRCAVVVHLPARPEGMGRTVIEAQACGTPVLTWPHGGLSDAVDPGRSGVLVPVGDVAAAAAAVIGLLEDERHRATLARGARQFAQRFSAPVTTAAIQRIYDEIVPSVSSR
jgi:glycosyltransferase involved in cell wall biosynthesis